MTTPYEAEKATLETIKQSYAAGKKKKDYAGSGRSLRIAQAKIMKTKAGNFFHTHPSLLFL